MSDEKKQEILDQQPDTEELNAVTGGQLIGSGGSGGCARDFFDRTCTATVEKGSWCRRNDYCELFSEKYEHVEHPMNCEGSWN